MVKGVVTNIREKVVFVAISSIIICCISFCVQHYLPHLWGEYLSVIPSLAFMEPLFLFWINSMVVRIGSVIWLAGALAVLSFFLYPSFIHLIKRGNRWFLLLQLVIFAVAAWWIGNQIDIPMPPGQRQVEIIPQSGLVYLAEMTIDGNPVELQLLDKGDGWAQKNNLLIYTGIGNAPVTYRYKNKTNLPLQLFFFEGQGAGSFIVKINGQARGEFKPAGEEGLRLIEVLIEPEWKLGTIFLVYTISIISLLMLISIIIRSIIQHYGALCFSIVYLFIIFTIQFMAVPEQNFYYNGVFILIYNAARFIFMVYLAAMLYSFGKFIFKVLKVPLVVKDDLGQTILFSFIGGSVLNIFMYLLGLINGIYFWVVLIITLPLVYISYVDLLRLFQNLKHYLSLWIQALRTWISSLNMQFVSISPIRLLSGIFIITAVTQAVILLIQGGLIPDSEGDVVTHYLPFYQAVLHNHGLSPNTVWYHYFYNQGSGLFFLSNLLTDKYGTQLVSYIYVLLSALILFSLIKRFSGSCLLRWFTVSMFFSILWDPDIAFSKLHIIEMSGLAFSMWVATKLYDHKKENSILFAILCGFGVVGLFLFSPKGIIFLLPFFFMVTGWFLLQRKAKETKSVLVIFGMLLASLLFYLGFNYITTGLFDDMPLRIMWNFADQDKFSQWVSPYMMLYLLEGSNSSLGAVGFNSPPPFGWYVRSFHLDKVLFIPQPWNLKSWYLFASLAALSASVLIGFRPNKRLFFDKAILFFLSSIVIVAAAILPIFLKQWVSLSRTYILTIFFTLLLLVSFWEMGAALIFQQKTSNRILNILLFIGWALLVFNSNKGILPINMVDEQGNRVLPHPTVTSSFNSILGHQAYADFTRIFEFDDADYYEAHRFIGEDERILSLNYSSTLPGRPIEREVDYAYREWHLMVFGEPEEAIKAFQREGINYFLISNSKRNVEVGALQYSPLFSSDSLPKNFDIIWKSDQTILITWKGTNLRTYPWEQDFLEVHQAKVGYPELYERVRLYYQVYGTNYPIYPEKSLPPVRGWQ